AKASVSGDNTGVTTEQQHFLNPLPPPPPPPSSSPPPPPPPTAEVQEEATATSKGKTGTAKATAGSKNPARSNQSTGTTTTLYTCSSASSSLIAQPPPTKIFKTDHHQLCLNGAYGLPTAAVGGHPCVYCVIPVPLVSPRTSSFCS
ncbi:Hypothetical predicted protein, partial [Drosophila guanche]